MIEPVSDQEREQMRLDLERDTAVVRKMFLSMNKEEQLRVLRKVYAEHRHVYKTMADWALEAPIGHGGIPANEIMALSMTLMMEE